MAAKGERKMQNNFAIVLDDSGSMNTLRESVISMFNRTVAKIAAEKGQEAKISLYYFGNSRIQEVFRHVEASKVKPLSIGDYNPSGNTPLFDAVFQATSALESAPLYQQIGREVIAAHASSGQSANAMISKRDKNGRFLKRGTHYTAAVQSEPERASNVVIVLTDGEENASSRSAAELRDLIQEKQSTDYWTFAFLVPPGYADRFKKLSGVHDGNIQTWNNAAEADVAVNSGLDNYFTARKSGKKATRGFFTTDLSQVKSKDLRNLTDISSNVKIWNVEAESRLDEFVTTKNGGAFQKGHSFYQLTKDEEVQDYKQVLLIKKGTKKVLCGARKLLGLPEFGSVKVRPGNHADYDIFVQSFSNNRKLVRGTKLVYLKTGVGITA